MSFKRVIVETPYKAATQADLNRNLNFARACAHDCLVNYHEAPFLSHLLYTQPGILDDGIPEERQNGIDAGLAWGEVAEATIVYTDRGFSTGMFYGVKNAQVNNRPVICRNLKSGIPIPLIGAGSKHSTKRITIDESDPDFLEKAVTKLFLEEIPHGSRVFYVGAMYNHIFDTYGPYVNLFGLQIPIAIGGPDHTVSLLYDT